MEILYGGRADSRVDSSAEGVALEIIHGVRTDSRAEAVVLEIQYGGRADSRAEAVALQIIYGGRADSRAEAENRVNPTTLLKYLQSESNSARKEPAE